MKRILLSAAVVAALALGGPASAQSARVTDSGHDVYRIDGDGAFSAVGTKANTDVIRTQVAHRAHDARVAVTYAHLVKGVSDFIHLDAVLATPHGGRTNVVVDIDWLMRDARVTLTGPTFFGPCSDASAVLHRTADTLILTVPRSCLGSPRWIKFRGSAVSTQEEGVFVDNAMDDAVRSRSWTKRLKPASGPSPVPTPSRVASGRSAPTTTVKLKVQGCDGCKVQAVQNVGGSLPYTSKMKRVSHGRVALVVPTESTAQMGFLVYAPFDEVAQAGFPMVVIVGWKDKEPGDRVSSSYASGVHVGSGCWAGTTDSVVTDTLVVTRQKVREPALGPGTFTAAAGHLGTTLAALPYFGHRRASEMHVEDPAICR